MCNITHVCVCKMYTSILPLLLPVKVEKLPEISTKDLEEIEEVLEQVAEEKLAKKAEEADMKKLKEDVEAYKEVKYNQTKLGHEQTYISLVLQLIAETPVS